MQIKEVLDSLIADDLVNVQKCGLVNVYWNFKFENAMKSKLKYDKLVEKMNELKFAKTEMIHDLGRVQELRGDYFQIGDVLYTRSEMMKDIELLSKDLKKLEEELNVLSQDNNKSYETMTQTAKDLRTKIEVVTDNIEILIQYLTKKTFLEPSLIRQAFDIPDEFEEI